MPATNVLFGADLAGTTAQRPTAVDYGQFYFDTTLGQQLVYTADGWKPAAGIFAKEVTFTEDGAGTYTGGVTVPAGATIVDIIVHAVALWAAGTSATMKVGDTDDDGFYTGVNLKATDLLAGESISFAQSGGKAGAYNAGTNTHWTNRYSASERTLNGIVTSVGAGTTGRTRMTVIYSLPTVTAATKA